MEWHKMGKINMRKKIGLVIVASLFLLLVLPNFVFAGEKHQQLVPIFVVDPFWPKPLPHNYWMGVPGGIFVDSHDHVWVNQRAGTLADRDRGPTYTPPLSTCCYPAPAVMEFDEDGNLLQAWGGWADPGFLTTRCTPAMGCDWPVGNPADIQHSASEHGIYVDHNDNVWVAGQSGTDNQILKFTHDGTFLFQIGRKGPYSPLGSNDTNGSPNGTPILGNPANMVIDYETNELYIADGYYNRRVLVVDATTGMYKRHWGAYGNPPVDGPLPAYNPAVVNTFFRNPVHHIRISKDGLVYVADRTNNRIQVFQKNGKFVKEFFTDRNTLGSGSACELEFSKDKEQKFIYVADNCNNQVWEFLRETGEALVTFGRGGRSAGYFKQPHGVAVDSKGNLYVAEVDTGMRVQKFNLIGYLPVDQAREFYLERYYEGKR